MTFLINIILTILFQSRFLCSTARSNSSAGSVGFEIADRRAGVALTEDPAAGKRG